MRKLTLAVVVACALSTTASTASAKAKRYWVPRAGPEILVVHSYGAPQVYVRRYEALVFEYVAARRYYARRYAACASPRRTVHACKVHRRY